MLRSTCSKVTESPIIKPGTPALNRMLNGLVTQCIPRARIASANAVRMFKFKFIPCRQTNSPLAASEPSSAAKKPPITTNFQLARTHAHVYSVHTHTWHIFLAAYRSNHCKQHQHQQHQYRTNRDYGHLFSVCRHSNGWKTVSAAAARIWLPTVSSRCSGLQFIVRFVAGSPLVVTSR